ncbi:MAG: ornithine decarboxylase, partial [Alphaproteobacteria bacterium]
MSAAQKSKHALSEYYSAHQLRTDRWSALRSTTERLRRAADGKAKDKLHERAESLIASLRPIELYWAFPGARAFDRLRHLLDEERYPELAKTVSTTVRLMLSDTFRHLAQRTDSEKQEDEDELADEPEGAAGGRKPYFEVLIVDQLSANKEELQRQALRKLRRPEDRFVYEPVFVPSIEDARIAV